MSVLQGCHSIMVVLLQGCYYESATIRGGSRRVPL